MEIDRLETTLRINDADFYRQMSAAERRMADFGRGIPTSGFDSYMSKITSSLTRAGAMITAGIGLPAALVAKEVLTVGSSFETAFAGVIKTVSATTPELAVMRQSFRDMAKEIPITADELAKIGESAGQLGVKKENILGFTRVMADLGVTTNLTSDQAATALARLANITQMPQESFDRLGATVVALGNAGASTEKDIVEMGLRIAGAGHAAGLTEANILGFANALSSVGIEAEAGGSAISRVFTTMSDAAKLGGKDLQIFAQVAGQSASAFKQSFQTDAAGAAVSFIEGLGKMSSAGLSLTPVLKELELSDIRVRDALLRASGAGDLFRQSLELGSKAWQENTALTNEAAERYKTFDSQVQLLKNALSDVAITLFDKLRPGLVSAVDGLKSIAEAIGKVNPAVLAAGAAFVGVFAAGGAAALAIGGFLTLIGGPLTIAIGLAAAAIGVLAGEWVLDSQKMGQASQSTGETIKQVFQGIAIGAGVIMDTIGVLANSIGLTLKSLALILVDVFSPVILAIGALSGKFTETWELIKRANSRLADDIVVSWDGLTADITGRWTKTMSGMVDTGFEAANQLGAAGSAGGGLYVKGFQHALNNIGPWADGIMSEAQHVANQLYGMGENAGLQYAYGFRSGVSNLHIPAVVVDLSTRLGTTPIPKELTDQWRQFTEQSGGGFAVPQVKEQFAKTADGWMVSTGRVLAEGGRKAGEGAANAAASGFGGGIKKHGSGGGFSKPFFDVFKEGADGFGNAVSTILKAPIANITALFDSLHKKGRASLEGLSKAFKDAAPVVNDFLTSQGINARVSADELAAWAKKGNTSLLSHTEQWKVLEEATRQAGINMAESLHSSVKDVNALLKEHGFEIELSAKLWDILTPAQKRAAVSLSDFAKEAGLANVEIDAQKDHFAKAIDVVTNFGTRVGLAFDDLKKGRITAAQFGSVLRGDVAPAIELVKENADGLSTSLTSLAERAERSLKKFKDAFENNFKLQDLNLKSNIFGAITSQLDQLAQISGIDKDILLQNMRDGMAGSVAAAGEGAAGLKEQIAKIDQVLLESQLSKLESVWGKPMSRAIESILVVLDKLHTSTVKKVAAISDALLSLPEALGGKGLRKIVSVVDEWVNFIGKIFTVLDAFKIKLPGVLGTIQDVFLNGAGSTTKAMKDMAEAVKLTVEDMKNQVVLIFKQMADESKKQIDSMKQGAQSGAQGIANNFIGGLSPLPSQVGGILNNIGGLFGGLGSKITTAIEQIIKATRGLNQVPTIFNSTANLIAGSANSIIGSLQNLALNSQNSLAAFQLSASQMQTGVGGMFKDIGSVILHAAGGAAQQANQAGQAIHQSLLAGILGTAAGGFVGGFGIGRGTGSMVAGGIGGGLTGAASGALAGMMIGAAGGPIGALGGAIIGGIAGIVGGIFGGMKSAFQKAMEKEQIAQAQFQTKLMGEQLKQMQQSTLQAIISTGSQLADLMNKAADTVFVPKEVINKFLKQGFSFLSKLADGMKDLAAKATPEIKAAAENFQPVIQMAASLPSAFEAINGHWGVADAQFEIFFRDYDKLIDGFLARAETAVKRQFKKAGKLAEWITPAVSLIAPLIEGITGINDVKEPTEASLSVIDRSLDAIVTHLGALGAKFEKYYLKTLRFFAEQAQAGLAVWKDATDAIRATVDVPVPKESDITNVVSGIRLFTEKLIAGVADLATQGLSRAVEIANAVSPIASAFKTWAESTEVISKYSKVSAETWDAVVFDFNRGLDLLSVLLNTALTYLDKATTFDDTVSAANLKLEHGLSSYAAGILNASSILNGTIGQLGGGVQPGGDFGASSFASSFAGSSVAPSFSAPSLTPSFVTTAPATKQTVISNHYTIGNVKLDKNDPRAAEAHELATKLFNLLMGMQTQEGQY